MIAKAAMIVCLLTKIVVGGNTKQRGTIRGALTSTSKASPFRIRNFNANEHNSHDGGNLISTDENDDTGNVDEINLRHRTNFPKRSEELILIKQKQRNRMQGKHQSSYYSFLSPPSRGRHQTSHKIDDISSPKFIPTNYSNQSRITTQIRINRDEFVLQCQQYLFSDEVLTDTDKLISQEDIASFLNILSKKLGYCESDCELSFHHLPYELQVTFIWALCPQDTVSSEFIRCLDDIDLKDGRGELFGFEAEGKNRQELEENVEKFCYLIYPFSVDYHGGTEDPTDQPSLRPSALPSTYPSTYPSTAPSIHASSLPSEYPSTTPTFYPSESPSNRPSIYPSVAPTVYPSSFPSRYPSTMPTFYRSEPPSRYPSASPTIHPNALPSLYPSIYLSTTPTVHPSESPSRYPSTSPTIHPNVLPSSSPSIYLSTTPTVHPSESPSRYPSTSPTIHPNALPSSLPSIYSSTPPTIHPSDSASKYPSAFPSKYSAAPTNTLIPDSSSRYPSTSPTRTPYTLPSWTPSSYPSASPTVHPSTLPSHTLTRHPSTEPTNLPNALPSTSGPTYLPIVPTGYPNTMPSSSPFRYSSSLPTSSTPNITPKGPPSQTLDSTPRANSNITRITIIATTGAAFFMVLVFFLTRNKPQTENSDGSYDFVVSEGSHSDDLASGKAGLQGFENDNENLNVLQFHPNTVDNTMALPFFPVKCDSVGGDNPFDDDDYHDSLMDQIDSAMTAGEWVTVAALTGDLSISDDESSALCSQLSYGENISIGEDRREINHFSRENTKRTVEIDKLLDEGDWAAVGHTVAALDFDQDKVNVEESSTNSTTERWKDGSASNSTKAKLVSAKGSSVDRDIENMAENDAFQSDFPAEQVQTDLRSGSSSTSSLSNTSPLRNFNSFGRNTFIGNGTTTPGNNMDGLATAGVGGTAGALMAMGISPPSDSSSDADGDEKYLNDNTNKKQKSYSWKDRILFRKKENKEEHSDLDFQEDSSAESSWTHSSKEGNEKPYNTMSDVRQSPIPPELEAFGEGYGLAVAENSSQYENSSGDSDNIDVSDKSKDSLRDELDRAIETGDWTEVEKQASQMLAVAGEVKSSESKENGDISSFDNSFDDESDSRRGWSSADDGLSISSNNSSIDDDRIRTLERLIETDDWQGIVTATRIHHRNEDSTMASSIPETNSSSDFQDAEQDFSEEEEDEEESDALSQDEIWQSITRKASR